MKREKEPQLWFGLSRSVILLFVLGVALPLFCSVFFHFFPLLLTFASLFFFGVAMLFYDVETRHVLLTLSSGENVDLVTLLISILGAILFSFGLAGFFVSIFLLLFPYK